MKYDALPTVSLEELDEQAFVVLMQDLAQRENARDCDLSVRTTESARSSPTTHASLAAAGRALAQGHVRAIQVRYRHNGVCWVDTILKTAGAFKLVRMEGDPGPG